MRSSSVSSLCVKEKAPPADDIVVINDRPRLTCKPRLNTILQHSSEASYVASREVRVLLFRF